MILFRNSANFLDSYIVLQGVYSSEIQPRLRADAFSWDLNLDRKWVLGQIFIRTKLNRTHEWIYGGVIARIDSCLASTFAMVCIEHEAPAAVLHLPNHHESTNLCEGLFTKSRWNHKRIFRLGDVARRLCPENFDDSTFLEEARWFFYEFVSYSV